MNMEMLYGIYRSCNKVCTDTRKLEKGDLFFALKGDNFNGNAFAGEALEKGASYVVIDEKEYHTGEKTVLVDNSLHALQQLALHHREQLKLPVIALTGSNGKTTTKELIHAVLSRRFRTVATSGNLNNHIGVPLTLLGMDNSTEMGIVEMGANHLEEISILCAIALPDYGYITNFGKAHLEGFGGIEGVIQGKSELYSHLVQHEKYIFYNADDPVQHEKLENYPRKFCYGTHGNTDVLAELTAAHPFVSLRANGIDINSHLIGSYNFNNIAAAVAIGTYFDIPANEIKAAIESYVPANNRSQIVEKNGTRIVLDAYNANPSSMELALENFATLPYPGKTVILGDMFELGAASEAEHQYIADLAGTLGLDEVILTGKHFFKTECPHRKFETFDDLKAYLLHNRLQNRTVLIKGSRGMALERVMEVL